MVTRTEAARRINAPWQDYSGRFSLLKAGTFAGMFIPAIWMASEIAQGNWDFPSPFVPLIYNSGVWATWLLLLGLAITPLRAIARLNGLIQVRRMIGIGALAYSLLHLVAWLGLRMWDWGALGGEWSRRPTLIIATVALIGLIVLGATSFDAAIRWMGGQRWKRLHAAIYWLAGLAVLHFLLSPGSVAGLPFLMLGFYVWLIAWRVLDRKRLGRSPIALAVLALATGMLTLLFEPLWTSTVLSEYALFGPLETLAFNFKLEFWPILGPPPSLVVVIAGLSTSMICHVAHARPSSARAVREIG